MTDLRQDEKDALDAAGLFPAPVAAPGQAASRAGYSALQAAGARGEIPWWGDFLAIRARLAARRAAGEIGRADWRVAAYLAWASSPIAGRWPATQQELATRVLGLRGDRGLRKWRSRHHWIDEEIAYWQAAPLLAHRRDVFEALVYIAGQKDPKAHSDRRLFLEMTGDFKPKQAVEQSGPDGGPVVLKTYVKVSPDDWDTSGDI